ncbi:phosphatidylinositol 4-phosphate 3-kinase C2 domain-containing subunit beta [Rhincodon typus]|uniref:phosphatidylinositol 4-phosphate 3-kinase C2 domain-containing subunit beta n=1 Tax=Rhincodon typus TaxID=259920 RepID=UPI002030C53A|nr:phosphatidylinositol 4-phosphate 3-kinase C2 domain-containing subunit beta [Rhincodon typus]
MSQPTGSKEHWKPWEFSGISHQELALAEALQMEYDALSRLRQSSTTRDDSKSKHINSLQLISFEDPLLEYSQLRNDCNAIKATHGLSGSDPGLGYSKGPSLSSRGIACSSTTSAPGPPNHQCQEDPEYQSLWKDVTTATTATTIITNSTISGSTQQPIRTGLFTTEGTSCHRGDYSIIDYAPPVPPRVPLGPSRNATLTDHWSKEQPSDSIEKLTIPNDINIFSPGNDDSNCKIVEPPSFYSNQRISDEEFELIDYDDLNDAITKLNLMSTYGENSKLIRVGSIGPNSICKRKDKKEESSGKPVSRSKTLPPQVPPRTYRSKYGNQNNAVYQDKNRKVSIDPGTLQQNYESWNYELLEVSEERNEEVAAFCHMLDIDFPSSAFDVKFITPPPAEFSPKYDFSSLDDTSRKRLKEVMQKKSLFWLTEEDKKLLWEKRYYCHTECSVLPLVLASAPSWEWACLPDIYTLLKQWNCLSHLDALGLLHATFPDQELRRTAVQWMETMSTSELVDFLPQLVQALKFECYLDSPLVRFLLRRAICDVKIAHYFYWLLKDALNDSHFSARYQHLLGALLCCVGKGMREEFDKQTKLTHILAKIAQKVRDIAPSSRQTVLRESMEEVQQFFNVQDHCRLPLNPSLLANGVNPRACSFFNSNAVPLKISFTNADPLGENINVIVKTGDDLRQDMLTLQMIRIMNKIWIQEGLDMRMIFFKCTSTGWGRGMVEMIPNAETLRRIQVEHGVTGSFKDHPLAEWLQKHNPNEEEYEKAVENFIYSCAGCCVATYVLGICDRHNDNIMLKTSGHMFHIDFGKFLGHAQMLGNFKRDRAPFVFTSDMAYVINGGDKPSSRFHDFVDLCCQAYNLIRKHTDLFLNLLGLMLSCGIPELSDIQDLRYVYDALRPQETDAHATTYFTRLIESSLGSVATKLNFFLHNLAQMKFSGVDDHPTLSYAPKTYTIKTDGKIKKVFVCRHQKIFNPNKGYAYVVKVEREGQHDAAFILRTFEEFNELHNKLRLLFPSSKLPSFPSRFVLGRGEAMADRRKEELDGYIWHLIHSPPEVAECDLVYTFFHPLPKDDKSAAGNTAPKPTDVPPTPPMGKVGGEVKLSISYKNDKLFIMVMHIRGLVLQDGTDPDPYVKIYLLPDPQKTSKRKTKVARKTCNPTYNEMLVYDGIPKGDVQQRVIHLRVLSEEAFRENIMLGEVYINLKDFNLNQKIVGWYHLGSTTPQGTLF